MKAFNNRAAWPLLRQPGSLALMLPAGAVIPLRCSTSPRRWRSKGTIKEFQWTNPHTWTRSMWKTAAQPVGRP
ncbi:MAG: hypothetical protein IPG49_16285 [Proteobacteria bacterium]|nr:hypothetical protein [Pseudomonadota bacterium]